MNLLRRILREELPFIFVCPAVLWQVFFLYLPLFALFVYSLFNYGATANFFSLTLKHYQNLFNLLYLKVILNSFILALVTALGCLLIAYPVAYFLVMKVTRFKTFFMFTLILPSWTSLIVQVYAWIFLLQKNGFLSLMLCRLGILSKSSHMLNNPFAIWVGMAYCFLPFMILPLYAVLEKMDKRLLEASADLGANRWQTFKKVVWPLSFPGVLAGFLLVFIPSFGEFAIPDLLGGGKDVFVGSMIVEKFLMTGDWESGAALTFLGIAFLMVLLVLCYFGHRFFKKFIKTKL